LREFQHERETVHSIGQGPHSLDLDVTAGRHGELVAELGELTALYPLREPMWARLLIVLDRCGRPAEALARYETARRRIADELGAFPGPELQRIHADLLTGRAPRLDRGGGAAMWSRLVPHQLPAAGTGRTGLIGRGDALAAGHRRAASRAPRPPRTAGPPRPGPRPPPRLSSPWPKRIAGNW
jgi:hypothetical protein